MAIVNDNRQVSCHILKWGIVLKMILLQYNFHGRDLSATVQNALDVVNAADLVRTHLVAHTLCSTLIMCTCLLWNRSYSTICVMFLPYLQLYRPLRVRVVVVHVITWTSGDRISVVSNPQSLLDNIRVFKRSVSQPHDSMMLITYAKIDRRGKGGRRDRMGHREGLCMWIVLLVSYICIH